MEVIGLETEVPRMEILRVIHSLFPKKELINWEGNFEKTYVYDGKTNRHDEDIPDNFSGFALQIKSHVSEFRTIITLFRTPEENTEERELFLASRLSHRLNCRTIIDGPAGLVDHPYCSVIIDRDKIFEANDLDTKWADGEEGGHVKIVRPIDLTILEFDEEGNKKY